VTLARVDLWGSRVGAVSWDAARGHAFFEYDKDFLHSGIELAPLMMPLGEKLYSFPGLSRAGFHGLPGLLADALPDRFGNALIDAWLASRGRAPESFDPVERLCYTGTRGMGALEFAPTLGEHASQSVRLNVGALAQLASSVFTDRAGFVASLESGEQARAMQEILRVGTSAGGARAKAVIAWNPETQDVRSGQSTCPRGFSHWLLKFDGVSGNRDRELDDPSGFGLIEYAYHELALSSGIRMNECRIFEEGGRSHFLTRRFDRTETGQKLHLQSFSALAHLDFNLAGGSSYEQVFYAIRRLELGMQTLEEQFRRMAFNVIARNQDDHVKNIAFLMDKSGQWSLSPAFDLTYSYNPAGRWTSRHQMTLNGKRDDFELADLEAVARAASLKRGRAEEIVEEVQEAVSHWEEIAERTGISGAVARSIRHAHRRLV